MSLIDTTVKSLVRLRRTAYSGLSPINKRAKLLLSTAGLLAALGGTLVSSTVAKADSLNLSLNMAAAFGWKVYADTDLKFSEFFPGNHTIMCRFMQQYPNAYQGPILSIKGSGSYMIGQGDYRDPTVGAKLQMVIGNNKAYYTLPTQLKPATWHHLAVVRSGAWFRLYLDGVHVPQDDNLFGDLAVLDVNGLPAGTATLRLGRKATGNAQFYGFVDDVAVFNTALSPTMIQSIAQSAPMRLTGNEAGLYAGYTFDQHTPAGSLPVKLSRPVTFQQPCKTLVSWNRDSGLDAKLLPLPFSQQTAMQLPFPKGQAWAVLQGLDALEPSHNGKAAFCWDFVRGDPITHQLSQALTKWQPLSACADGTVTQWVDSGDQDPSDGINYIDGPNYLEVRHAPQELCTYMHTQTGSITQAFSGQGLLSFSINAGEHVGNVGTRGLNNYHLHLAVTVETGDVVTFPVAFSNYEASDDQGGSWYHVALGVPKQNQWIKRL